MATLVDDIMRDLPRETQRAVSYYWQTRMGQQQRATTRDQGARSAVTGGAQMNGFIELLSKLIAAAGVPEQFIFTKKDIELPGFFRPTKEWDLVVVKDHVLLAAIEAKSQVGPSFGNNFNNRTEEAMGSALCLWTAYREKAFQKSPQPFLGYFFMLEDCDASNRAVKVQQPHFNVFPEFVGASYMKRYEIFCRKLVLERHYSAAAFLSSKASDGVSGIFSTPAEDLSFERFARALAAHVLAFR